MQKKIYIGGLPWELDRIGLLNYFKVMLEGTGVEASYELPFISTPVEHPNATVKVVDAFVAMDRDSGKSRGFGFITMEFGDQTGDDLFNKIVDTMNGKVMIGIRGPRDLIVNEATPRDEDGGSRHDQSDEEVF